MLQAKVTGLGQTGGAAARGSIAGWPVMPAKKTLPRFTVGENILCIDLQNQPRSALCIK
jgi:hypothetical protein